MTPDVCVEPLHPEMYDGSSSESIRREMPSPWKTCVGSFCTEMLQNKVIAFLQAGTIKG